MTDFLIVGQGIAGSILAYQLLKRGKQVIILEESPPSFIDRTAKKIVTSEKSNTFIKYAETIYPQIKSAFGYHYKPKVIGGLISPITGKRFVKTWLADILLPFADTFYKDLEKALDCTFYQEMPLVRLFANAQQANEWHVKQADDEYKKFYSPDYVFRNSNITAPFGYIVLKGAVVDGMAMLSGFYSFFKKRGLVKSIHFSAGELKIHPRSVSYGNLKASAVILCEGWKAVENSYFKDLPFMPAKGELLVIKSPGLNLKELINKGIFVRPLGNSLYMAGSTYKWGDLSVKPTAEAKVELEEKLKQLIKTDFSVVEQLAGIRPTVKGRRPFLGKHPLHSNTYIFNGLGTKGLLLAPYFADHFCNYLLNSQPLLPEVDILRFYK